MTILAISIHGVVSDGTRRANAGIPFLGLNYPETTSPASISTTSRTAPLDQAAYGCLKPPPTGLAPKGQSIGPTGIDNPPSSFVQHDAFPHLHVTITPSTGSPEAVARPRLPQNVACRFPALRSSEVGSQHSDRL